MSSRGFTLIELLIVIGIIGLLVSLTLVVGGQVMSGGKQRLTLDTLKILDNAMDAYVHSTEGNPAPYVAGMDPLVSPAQPNVLFIAADARDMEHSVTASSGGVTVDGNQMINSVGVFMYQASKVPDAKGILDKLPSRVVRTFDADGIGPQPLMPTVFDGWDRPIRYVHPAFQGVITGDASAATVQPGQPRPTAQVLGAAAAGQAYSAASVRRNHTQTVARPRNAQDWPDSDGGTCIGGRPYFYSSGPDGLVGIALDEGGKQFDANLDNVYTTRPPLPAK
jgi:prepilin-type N-terminal cleavage/methylation domain-containing protein